MSDILTTQSGVTFHFKKGITDKQIDQLIHYAQTDDTVKGFTSDSTRFASRESFNNWKKDSSVFYTLTDDEDNLMGIIWFEQLPLPEVNPIQLPTSNFKNSNYNTTFAIRLYSQARGQGLSAPFTQKALEDHGQKGIWLATSPDNIPAINSYKKTGFVELGIRKDGQKLVMILI